MAFITIAGEQLIAVKQGASQVLVVQDFVLANIPGLGVEPANRIEALPPAGQIVDTKAVTHQGYVNGNQVVFSLALDSTIGDYDFNWVGLKSAEGTLVACEHIPLTQKRKTVGAVQGNNLTRNFLLAFSGATATTAIAVPASTWQIDFTSRLLQIDDRDRLSNLDDYGQAAFFGDGFKVTLASGTTYNIASGLGYVAGIRCEKSALTALDVGSLPKGIWMDVSLQGDINGVAPVIAFVPSAAVLADNIDGLGFKHYLLKIADIAAGGVIADLRQDVIVPQAEAEAGVATIVKRWTALRVRQAARAALRLPSYALPLPVINSESSTIPVSATANAANGGTVSLSANTAFSLANELTAGFGVVEEYQTTAFTSPALTVNSNYFLRAKVVAGTLVFYVQKGTLYDAVPASLKGTENAASGGGFYSTPYDICIAQVLTGAANTTPVVRPIVNSRTNQWSARLNGNGTIYLGIDPFVVKSTLVGAIATPHASLVSNLVNASAGWTYSSLVTIQPTPGSPGSSAILTNTYSVGSAPFITTNVVVGDMAIATMGSAYSHNSGKMLSQIFQSEHQLGANTAANGDEELLSVATKNMVNADYTNGLAITYTNCVDAKITWEIMR